MPEIENNQWTFKPHSKVIKYFYWLFFYQIVFKQVVEEIFDKKNWKMEIDQNFYAIFFFLDWISKSIEIVD